VPEDAADAVREFGRRDAREQAAVNLVGVLVELATGVKVIGRIALVVPDGSAAIGAVEEADGMPYLVTRLVASTMPQAPI